MGLRVGNGGASAGWPLDALHAAIVRADDVIDDVAQAQRTADEIRRALVQVRRIYRDAERAAARALERLAGIRAS